MSKLTINTLIAERWSPFFFDARPVEREKIETLFEAVRRSPSCRNAQPWSFILAPQGEPGFTAIFETLIPFNHRWCQDVPLLGMSVAQLVSPKTGEPNRFAYHDVGIAMGHLILQAAELGLATRIMGGFDVDQARANLQIPEGYDPVSAFAIGYAGAPNENDPELAEKHRERRPRKEVKEFLFENAWGTPFR